MNFPVVCVLLLAAAAAVQCRRRRPCYQAGVDCRRRNTNSGSDWLETIEESQARVQGQQLSAAELERRKEYACKCCCSEEPCPYSSGLCGDTCPIRDCYTHVLAKAAADESPSTPDYSAEVLTAALVMQKEHQQQKKARLQELMEDLISIQGDDGDGDSLPDEQYNIGTKEDSFQ